MALAKSLHAIGLTNLSDREITKLDEDTSKISFLEEIRTKYEGFLRNVVSSQIQDEFTTEDILQDYYLSLLTRSLPENIKDIKAFLYVSINNQIRDYIRKQKFDQYRYRVPNKVNNTSISDDIEELSAKSDHLNVIEKHLTAEQFEAIKLRYEQSLKISEISDQMGIRSYTVKKYLKTAFEKLRKVLSKPSEKK